MIDFSHIGFWDVVDVLLFLAVLYYLYKIIRGTVAVNIFIGIAIVYAFWKITQWLHMRIMSEFLGQFLGLGVIALLIVFQQEIRQFLLFLGSKKFDTSQLLNEWKFFKTLERQEEKPDFEAILSALKNLSIKKHGALIVIKKNASLDFLKNTGDKMDIAINEPIIESIFMKNGPLHDGAVVVEGNRITAARAVIPIAPDIKLPKKFGLRHLAAVSITKNSDAIALAVSEETGKVSMIKDGKFVPYKSYEDLLEKLKREFRVLPGKKK